MGIKAWGEGRRKIESEIKETVKESKQIIILVILLEHRSTLALNSLIISSPFAWPKTPLRVNSENFEKAHLQIFLQNNSQSLSSLSSKHPLLIL